MGKKRITVLGSEDETKVKAKRAVQLEQKKLRTGKNIIPEKETLHADTSVAETAPVQEIPVVAPATPAQTTSNASKKNIRLRSVAYKQAKSQINPEQTYSLSDALNLLSKVSLTKFDPSVELHIVLKNGQLNQTLELPFSAGRTKVIALADEKTIAEIESGTIKFDVLIASPAQMSKLVKFAKVLGPRGLMPNPKNGTVVDDPEAAAKKMAGSVTVSLKTEKSAPVIHLVVGKLSQKQTELTKNIETIISALPAGNIKKVVLKSTMSPAIKIQF